MVKWKINKNEKEKYKHLNTVIDILNKKNNIFRTYTDKEVAENSFNEWMEKLESEKEFSWSSGFSILGNFALPLIRQTFPSLFANKVVSVQPMSTPVGLAYAMRVIYDTNEEGLSAQNNV